MLDLKAGIDLHEEEVLRSGFDQELHRAGIAVAGRGGQADGGRLDGGLGTGRQGGGRRLLDHLLVAPLDAAVAHADRPARPVGVRDDLHLDVAGRLDEVLEEDGRVAEGQLGLATRRPEGRLQVGRGPHDADPSPAATRGRLEGDGVPELLGLRGRVRDGVDRPASPRQHRHVRLLGQPLGGDLVAEGADGGAVRPHEEDARVLAALHEGRPF